MAYRQHVHAEGRWLQAPLCPGWLYQQISAGFQASKLGCVDSIHVLSWWIYHHFWSGLLTEACVCLLPAEVCGCQSLLLGAGWPATHPV